MSSDSLLISAQGLSKTYRIFAHPGDRLKQAATFGLRHFHRKFSALHDTSFDVQKGEIVGIIGRNGSGKSTLLQLICRILHPTSGSVELKGRISALLELGTGFHPEFTGRENVFFQGAILGFSRAEMADRYERIAAFAGIDEFMDQPVRTYSSGMFVRLAFAVAVEVDPDILIVDEAIAVGDAAFQAKCFRRIREMRERGCAILFVSHSSEQILRLCTRAILLDHGRMVMDGHPTAVVEKYRAITFNTELPSCSTDEENTQPRIETRLTLNPFRVEFGNFKARIVSATITDGNGCASLCIHSGERFSISYAVRFDDDIANPVFGFTVRDEYGQEITGTNTHFHSIDTGCYKSGDIANICFTQSIALRSGQFFLSLNCTGFERGQMVAYHRAHDMYVVSLLNGRENLGLVDPASLISLDRS